MKKLLFILYLFISETGLSQSGEVDAVLRDVDFNSIDMVFVIRYDILNYQNDELYLIDIQYEEFIEYRVVYPVDGSISGDGGLNAVRGGTDKYVIWNFSMQPYQDLKMGEITIDITEIKKEESRKILRYYKKQYRINNKIEKRRVKSKRTKRLKRRLDRINRKIRTKRY